MHSRLERGSPRRGCSTWRVQRGVLQRGYYRGGTTEGVLQRGYYREGGGTTEREIGEAPEGAIVRVDSGGEDREKNQQMSKQVITNCNCSWNTSF